jgi:hypothetical protein
MKTSRLDRIIIELEKLQTDADGIINSFVQARANQCSASFGATKATTIFPHAGSTLDRVAALKHVKQELSKV